jgi:hypothetical protein
LKAADGHLFPGSLILDDLDAVAVGKIRDDLPQERRGAPQLPFFDLNAHCLLRLRKSGKDKTDGKKYPDQDDFADLRHDSPPRRYGLIAGFIFTDPGTNVKQKTAEGGG